MRFHRDEDPIGKWTIKVNDQDIEDESGRFIGWSLTLWGSANDPKRVKPYVLRNTENLPFPPPELPQEPIPSTTDPTTSATTIASTTKSYTKPTVHLSTGMPAPTTVSSDSSDKDVLSISGGGQTSQPSSMPSQEPNANDAMSDSTRFWISAVGSVASILLIGFGAFLVIRQMRRNKWARYDRVSDAENLRMTSIDGARVTSSGRDRHGDVVFDEEEEMHLTAGDENQVASGPVGFHSGFLDDDDQATTSAPLYRDEPSEAEQHREAASANASKD